MTTKINNPDQYIAQLPDERKQAAQKLREIIVKNLPEGFQETINYDMIGYVVPHSLYPPGYHCDPKLPLPFINIASQKKHIALYHMGIYADPHLLNWFTDEYPKYCKTKLDMGKSCIRFKKPEDIPYALIGQLAQKISPKQWVNTYEEKLKR